VDIATPAKRFYPNDDVNRSQSSNDTFPTVMHVATVEQMSNVLVPAAKELRDTLAAKAKEYDNVVMVGRTHLQDKGGADFAARYREDIGLKPPSSSAISRPSSSTNGCGPRT
jgi:fumarate hydratase class II